MGIVNSKTGEEKNLSVQELIEATKKVRAYDVVSIHAAGSGHPGGTLSTIDLATALYLTELKHDPADPNWPGRDRVFWSAGHKAPALYSLLAYCGYYKVEDIMTLRKLGSKFQGHPDCRKMNGVEVSTGSLGQGLGIAAGNALAAKIDGKNYRCYVLMGDGEQQEGSVWEAAMFASHHKLDNLVAIVDKNKLQIDGKVAEVMNIDPIDEKYKSFGWEVIRIDGHDMQQIVDAYAKARTVKDKPVAIIADTCKGQGVSFMQNVCGWHGVATKKDDELNTALNDITHGQMSKDEVARYLQIAKDYQAKKVKDTDAKMPKFKNNYWWNSADNMKAEMDPTRFGFGRALEKMGDDKRLVTIHADISDSIKITDFEKNHPDRKNRVFSAGIAEQNMMQVAVGLAKEGKIPVTGTYGVFASGRCWDQIRTSICYPKFNVKIAGAHGGISVGADGATHQALEEISILSILPNMTLAVPADSVETEKSTKTCFLDVNGPVYIRFAREATPVISKTDTPFKHGMANVIRFRGETANFVDAFETKLASNYKNENEHIAIIACGPMVSEAMRAAYILKKEYGIETRIVNIHTIKPIDINAIKKAVSEIGVILTAEEHQVGGFGNIVAGIAAKVKDYKSPLVIDQLGIMDRFGESGDPWMLMKEFGLTAEHIAVKAYKLVNHSGKKVKIVAKKVKKVKKVVKKAKKTAKKKGKK